MLAFPHSMERYERAREATAKVVPDKKGDF